MNRQARLRHIQKDWQSFGNVTHFQAAVKLAQQLGQSDPPGSFCDPQTVEIETREESSEAVQLVAVTRTVVYAPRNIHPDRGIGV